MKTIKISGVIGQDVLASDVTKQIEEARGDNLTVEINSIGGSVFQGTEIFNALRAYGKRYPGASIEITVTGVAASMASYIASLPGARVTVYDNAVMMLHNPSNLAMGDYRDMKKNATFLEGLAGLMRKAYAERSGKSTNEIAEMMDAETWLYGSEIKEQGFADAVIESQAGDQQDAAAAIARVQMQYQETAARIEDRTESHKAAAIMRAVTTEAGITGEEEKQGMTEREHADAIQATIRAIASDSSINPFDKASQIARLQQAAKVAAIPDGMYQKGGKTILDFTDEDGLIDYAAASAWFAQFDHNGNRFVTEV